MRFLFHPVFVHFPIALWLTSFFLDVLFVTRRDRFFAAASRWLMGLGLIAALVAIVMGFVDYVPLVAEGVGQAFVDRHRIHSVVAYITTGTYAGVFMARWRWRPMSAGVYLGTAAAAAALITLTGIFGHELRRVM